MIRFVIMRWYRAKFAIDLLARTWLGPFLADVSEHNHTQGLLWGLKGERGSGFTKCASGSYIDFKDRRTVNTSSNVPISFKILQH